MICNFFFICLKIKKQIKNYCQSSIKGFNDKIIIILREYEMTHVLEGDFNLGIVNRFKIDSTSGGGT
jgi:hypothetical protein